jgi:hypothetical protein
MQGKLEGRIHKLKIQNLKLMETKEEMRTKEGKI